MHVPYCRRKTCLIPRGKVLKRKCHRRHHCGNYHALFCRSPVTWQQEQHPCFYLSFLSVSKSFRKLRLKKHISRRLKQNHRVQSLQMRVFFRRSWSPSRAQWSDGSTAETDEEELSVSSRSSYASQTSNFNLFNNGPETLSLMSYSSGRVDSVHFKREQISPKASVLMEGVQSLDEDDLACLGLASAKVLNSACFKLLVKTWLGVNPVSLIFSQASKPGPDLLHELGPAGTPDLDPISSRGPQPSAGVAVSTRM